MDKVQLSKGRKYLYFLLGLGMTSPLLAVVAGGRIFSLYTISLALVVIDLLLCKNKVSQSTLGTTKHSRYFVYWMVISIASCIWGFFYFIGDLQIFAISALKNIPKILFYLVLYFLVGRDSKGCQKMRVVFEGLKYGILLNLIWAILDASLFYITGESLNNNIFASYIAAEDRANGQLSIIEGYSIRSAGLNVDMAIIGFFSVCAAVYALIYNKTWLLIVAILASLAGVTFIGLVGITCALLWQTFFRRGVKHKIRNVILISVPLLVALVYVNTSNNEIIEGMRTAVELRAESKKDKDDSAGARILFITKFPKAVTYFPTSLFIGTGYGSGVYAYYQEGLTYSKFSKSNPVPASMENTFVEYFFAIGLPGLIIFCLMYLNIYKISYRRYLYDHDEFYALMFAYAFGSFFIYAFYHTILYSIHMFACITAAYYLRDLPRSKEDL